jgi:hypothetical protein
MDPRTRIWGILIGGVTKIRQFSEQFWPDFCSKTDIHTMAKVVFKPANNFNLSKFCP